MGNYLGVKCPVCSGRFAAADDIVVCPACGAPHHRHCYAERGECAFAQDHISGKEWRPPVEDHAGGFGYDANSQSTKTCGRCGSANPPQALFCQICGQSMTAAHSYAGQRQGGFRGDPPKSYPNYSSYFHDMEDHFFDSMTSGKDPISDLPAKDVAIYIGSSAHYYLPRFYQIDGGDRVLQFNAAACFLGFFYYFYRRMYRAGAVMLALSLICMVPFFMFSWEILPAALYLHQHGLPFTANNLSAQDMQIVHMYTGIVFGAAVFNFVVSLILSLFANKMYYRQVVENIRALMREYPGHNEYRMALSKAGGVDRLSVILIGTAIFVGSNAIISFMAYFL